MKKLITLLSTFALSSAAMAQVTIELDNRAEILAVNQQLSEIVQNEKGQLVLNNGKNQLLVRMTAMYDTNGGKAKYESQPMVLLIDEADKHISIKTPFPIRDQRAVNKYQKSPSLSITANGEDVAHSVEILGHGSFEVFKDYDKTLATYNKKGGVAAVASSAYTVGTASSVNSTAMTQTVNTQPHPKDMTISAQSIRGDFLQLSPEQRQEFLSWAVKNLNN